MLQVPSQWSQMHRDFNQLMHVQEQQVFERDMLFHSHDQQVQAHLDNTSQ